MILFFLKIKDSGYCFLSLFFYIFVSLSATENEKSNEYNGS
jgi:hypothetical protein